MTPRYDLRKHDHPEGNRWTIVDTRTGEPAQVDGIAQAGLPLDDADELADELNQTDGELHAV